MSYLAFNLNDGNEFVFDLLDERLSLGRDSENDIVIDNTYISAFHAEFLRQSDGGYEVVDLQSSNGTFVNGQRVERSLVKGGDKIRFGQLEARFRDRSPQDAAEIKSLPTGKEPPRRIDGKRGDTESVPARDANDAAASQPGPVLARPTTSMKAAPTPTPISPPPSTGKEASVSRPHASEEQEAELEAGRSALARLREDIETATRSLEKLHADADQARTERLQQTEDEKKRLADATARVQVVQAELERLSVERDRAKVELEQAEARRLEAEASVAALQASREATASEQELTLQMRLSAVREALERETARLEQVRRERQAAEAELPARTQVVRFSAPPSEV